MQESVCIHLRVMSSVCMQVDARMWVYTRVRTDACESLYGTACTRVYLVYTHAYGDVFTYEDARKGVTFTTVRLPFIRIRVYSEKAIHVTV